MAKLSDYQHLIDQKLVSVKTDAEGRSIIKYGREVFYKNLWKSDPLLVEARGHVFDKDGNQLVFPPTKVFNYLENGAGADLDDHTELCAVRKVNGFLACATIVKGKLEVVSTTGSLTSEFVSLANKHLNKLNWESISDPVEHPFYQQHMTLHFEIVDESDPHIVRELPGAYLIGCKMADGREANEHQLDDMSYDLGAMRPGWFYTFMPDLKLFAKNCKHEGFMVKLVHTGVGEKTIFKWKSPYYLTKKFLMRMGKNKAREMFSDPIAFKMKLDEEFYDVFDHIVENYNFESWSNLKDQDRRAVMEDHLNG